METQQLRAELEEMVRQLYEPTFERQRERMAQLSTLTDAEFWQHHLHNANDLARRTGNSPEVLKRHMIEHRFDQLDFLNGDGPQQIIDAKVEKLMPMVTLIRAELNEDGPLTVEQFRAASHRETMSHISQMGDQIKASVSRQTDARKSALLSKLASKVDQDAQDMKILSNPDLTQEQLEEVTSKMAQRWRDWSGPLAPPMD